MNDAQKAKLINELSQFTGSETFYYHPLFRKFVYTEGVRHLVENAGAYWLLENFIFPKQAVREIAQEEFQVWTIKVNQQECSAVINLEDGDTNEVCRFLIPFTDFPLDKFTLWFIGGTLLLPNEY